MRTSRKNRQIPISLLMLFVTSLISAQQQPPEGTTFEVASVRVLSSKEAADRSPDFVGPNVAVRLRVRVGARGLRFYSWKNSAIPAGYKIQRSQGGEVEWMRGDAAMEGRSSSPGIQGVLFGSTGEWMTLPAFSSIEWEELDSTMFAGKRHAFTIFVKRQDKDEAKEIVSDWFDVPAEVGAAK